ncbi:hypothetical protein [Clostridium phage CP3]|nr:hypothetical protein [Clostridium phage CP3]
MSRARAARRRAERENKNLNVLKAVDIMLALSCYTLKKEGYGKTRMTRFVEEMSKHTEEIEKGTLNYETIMGEIKDLVPPGIFDLEEESKE